MNCLHMFGKRVHLICCMSSYIHQFDNEYWNVDMWAAGILLEELQYSITPLPKQNYGKDTRPFTWKRTLTTFRQTGFPHGSLASCSRLENSSERVAKHNHTGSQKSLTSSQKFYTLEKKFVRVGQWLISVTIISQVNANGFWKITVV